MEATLFLLGSEDHNVRCLAFSVLDFVLDVYKPKLKGNIELYLTRSVQTYFAQTPENLKEEVYNVFLESLLKRSLTDLSIVDNSDFIKAPAALDLLFLLTEKPPC